MMLAGGTLRRQRLIPAMIKADGVRRELRPVSVTCHKPVPVQIQAQLDTARMKTGGPIQFTPGKEFVPLNAEAAPLKAAKQRLPAVAHVPPRVGLGKGNVTLLSCRWFVTRARLRSDHATNSITTLRTNLNNIIGFRSLQRLTGGALRNIFTRPQLLLLLVISPPMRYAINVITDHFRVFRHPLTRDSLAMLASVMFLAGPTVRTSQASDSIDFNRDIRRILSDNCFKCHGPDDKERKGGKKGLRLDTPEDAQVDLGGYRAIVPGQPDKSELVKRITTNDADDQMPPTDSGKKLTQAEIVLLQNWIKQGAPYSRHWSYIKPTRPALPRVKKTSWPKNEIDFFILDRLEREGLAPAPEAERSALIRRVALDLTGLPPTLAEVDQFMNDRQPGAYERCVDRLLAKAAFGEHWARLWLDQARYADSSGYADDPARTIWAYRDYVIRALNANKPFDQFTLEQIAGDLLAEPTEEELIATAFHRNTLTNNEGGTNDEEYRNVAVVDRVNTTMAVWMGTTMACAQCHSHKYDPITQEDYFRLFAILNNTEDADRMDESPVLPLYTAEQKRQRRELEKQIAPLEKTVQTPTPQLLQAQKEWENTFAADLKWQVMEPTKMNSKSGAAMTRTSDGDIRVERGGKTDVYTIETPIAANETLTALRLETLPDDSLPAKGPGHAGGNFVISRVLATVTPPGATALSGRYLRIEIPGKDKFLSLAEVQVFSGTENVATKGEAKQSSTAFGGPANLAIDGNTNGNYDEAKSTTHTEASTDPWWELDLKSAQSVDRIVLWNRTDGGLGTRLNGFTLTLLDEKREPVWQQEGKEPPKPSSEFFVSTARPLIFAAAYADFEQEKFEAANVLENKDVKEKGWAIAPQFGKAHTLTLTTKSAVELRANSTLTLSIEQLSKHEYATLGRFRFAFTSDPRATEFGRTPASILAILKTPADQRKDSERSQLTQHYLSVAPALAAEREQLASLKKQHQDLKPYSTVPILRELAGDKRRKTHLQHRGNFLDLGKEVTEGLPATFDPNTNDAQPNRLTLAKWLVGADNPLTARVAANRLWESIFGIGIVRTSEEFGAQSELPSHPELLDWLATELMQQKWDIKHMLRLMATSAAYRQSSRVTPELTARDPENRLLARGPRFRLSAEMIRDQAMFISGLLSPKMYGPPVKPVQPKLGLSAAFGSGTDWETSAGEDRYRRALYTTWRRSSPYPSMATFDAPNREVCTVRRERSNTPLQALVTLNDPVYVEAAQALARRMNEAGATPADKARYGFRLCLARPPTDAELSQLLQLYEKTRSRFVGDLDKAQKVAAKPGGTAETNADVVELAAWAVVSNVLLNLDETLMKR